MHSIKLWHKELFDNITGKSKGVMLSHNNINAVAMQYRLGMEHRRHQKYMVIIPPFIAFGICVAIHLPLCLGMICIPIPKFEVASFYNLLKKYKPNHFTCTPSNLEYLSNDKRKINLSCSNNIRKKYYYIRRANQWTRLF